MTIRNNVNYALGGDIDNVPRGNGHAAPFVAVRNAIILGTDAFALCAASSPHTAMASSPLPHRSSGVGPSWRRALRGVAIGFALLLPLQASWAADGSAETEPPAASAPVETIVLMRHGEKPMEGFGQLNCQGLNRSIALPKVLQAKFGRPYLIMAPNPSILKSDWGRAYAYVRPLATIEPTAIANGMPVDVALGYEDQDALVDRLLAPGLEGKTVFVAWEHRIAEQAAKALLKRVGATADAVPRWPSGDYDSLYVVRVTGHAGGARTATFTHDYQQLNGVATGCP